RKAEPALRRGEWKTLLVDDAKGVYGFGRYLTPLAPLSVNGEGGTRSPSPFTERGLGGEVLVILNTSTQPQTVELPILGNAARWRIAVSTTEFEQAIYPAANGRLRITLPPLAGTALVPDRTPSIGGNAQ
ncbi:MAG: alpha-glucosidase C-terminal domain-containing protein, partial [Fimbriimonadales bacterium]|nr:alpha-glucosidase C-terminal domain-containing protein [Fimbriimonadales bacterium]